MISEGLTNSSGDKDPKCGFVRSICCCKWQIHAFAFSTAVDFLILVVVFTFYYTPAVF